MGHVAAAGGTVLPRAGGRDGAGVLAASLCLDLDLDLIIFFALMIDSFVYFGADL